MHVFPGCWPYYYITFFICHVVAMSSTCYNPLLYGWFNNAFRFLTGFYTSRWLSLANIVPRKEFFEIFDKLNLQDRVQEAAFTMHLFVKDWVSCLDMSELIVNSFFLSSLCSSSVMISDPGYFSSTESNWFWPVGTVSIWHSFSLTLQAGGMYRGQDWGSTGHSGQTWCTERGWNQVCLWWMTAEKRNDNLDYA